MLFSNATNWKGKPFVRLRDFIRETKAFPDFEHQASEMAKENLEYTNIKALSPEEKEVAEMHIRKNESDLKDAFLRESLANFSKESVLKFIRYRNSFFINLEKMKDPENTYVLPIFFKPGRTHFMIRTPIDRKIKSRVDKKLRVRIFNYQKLDDVHFRFYYNRHIVPVREEKIPACKCIFCNILCS